LSFIDINFHCLFNNIIFAFTAQAKDEPQEERSLSDSEDEAIALSVRVAPRDPLPSRARATAKYVFSDSE